MPEVSHNQLAVTLTKACVGAGVARGVAEDVAQALAALTNQEREAALTELCKALDSFDNYGSQPTTLRRDGDRDITTISQGNLLHNGPGLVELAIVLADDGGALLVQQIDYPHCFKALVAAKGGGRMEETSSGTVLTFKEERTDLIAPTPARGQANRAQVDRALWARLLHHAHATMVPSDAASQADAGAGDGDND
ncbi:MAG: DUF3726 domain-containing protein [Pseudomonadota bacterium]